MANGMVCTGFSKPYVALYSASGGVVTYSKGRILARGVSISPDVEVGGDNVFYADNVAAEVSPGIFTGGNLTLTVDGLLPEAEALIMGLTETEEIETGGTTVEVTKYNDNMKIPYVGIGVIIRYLSGGVTSFVPAVYRKARFAVADNEAETQGESLDYQTQDLTAALMRDDTPEHNWKFKGKPQATEEEAENIIKAILNITGEAA